MASFVYCLSLNTVDENKLEKLREYYGSSYKERIFFSKISRLLLKYGMEIDFQQVMHTDIFVGKEKNGSPYLKNSNLCISFSHGKNVIGCAISTENIGVDVQEKIKYKKEYGEFALSKSEKRQLVMCGDYDLCFTIMWS